MARAIAVGAALLPVVALPSGPALSQSAGGPRVELVLQVDWRPVLGKQLEEAWEALRLGLQSDGIAYTVASMDDVSLTLSTDDRAALPRVEERAEALEPMLAVEASGPEIFIRASEAALAEMRDGSVGQSLAVLRRRVEQADLLDPVVERDGIDRIRVAYSAHAIDPAELIPLLLRRGELEFRFVAERPPTSPRDWPPAETIMSADGRSWLVEWESLLTGADIASAEPTFAYGELALQVSFTDRGSEIFAEATARSIGRMLAIVLDGEVISVPTIRSAIPGGTAVIEGQFTLEEAQETAAVLMSGALPVPLTLLSEQVLP